MPNSPPYVMLAILRPTYTKASSVSSKAIAIKINIKAQNTLINLDLYNDTFSLKTSILSYYNLSLLF